MHQTVLVVVLATALNFVNSETTESPVNHQQRKDLEQINYYNWLLHRHRTEKAKIEKLNSDIREERLKKLQLLMDTPLPNNVTLLATQDDYEMVKKMLHPINGAPVDDKRDHYRSILVQKRSPQAKADDKKEDIIEFQLSEREFKKYGKFLRNKTLRRFVH